MKSRIILITLFITTISFQARSQDYIHSIGLRGGLSQGITYKYFMNRTDAFEGILAMRWNGFYVTGLWERHTQAFDVDRLYFYYGGGGHIGFWDSNTTPWFDNGSSNTVLGVDGIIGLEYVFYEIPLNVGIDWKPAFNLIGVTNFWGSELGISLRFYF